jgi:hypothetical protein
VFGEEHGTLVNLLATTTGSEGGQRGPAPAAASRVKKRVATVVCGNSKRRPTWLVELV